MDMRSSQILEDSSAASNNAAYGLDKYSENSFSEKLLIKIWIKTLLYSRRTLPKIIETIDKLIVIRASKYSFSSDIFNTSDLENQIDVVINLGERKDKLLNIYVMTDKLLSFLPKEDREFAKRKFCDHATSDELAEEFDISVRTVYRKSDGILCSLYASAKQHRWSLKFIEVQVSGEDWLLERFQRYLKDISALKSNS